MIDIETMFESEHEPSYTISRAMEETGIILHGLFLNVGFGFEVDPEELTRIFFQQLVKVGGTAADFDWIRGLGFCALEDWQYFEAAEALS